MNITVDELKAKKERADQFFLLDVREVHEHEEFNIGGKLIPLGIIMSSLDDLMPHKDEEVIVYCRSGNRSGMAQMLLQQAGFSNIKNLTGGVLAWQEMGAK